MHLLCNSGGATALHKACVGNHEACARVLTQLAPGVIDTVDASGCTALMRAAAKGHRECVRVLLAAGADTSVRAREGTAVDIARKYRFGDGEY